MNEPQVDQPTPEEAAAALAALQPVEVIIEDPRDVLVFGPGHEAVKALATTAGINYDEYRDKYAAQIMAMNERERSLQDVLRSMLPGDAYAAFPAGLDVMHVIEDFRSNCLAAINGDAVSPEAAQMLATMLPRVNDMVVSYISAASRMAAVSVAGLSDEQYAAVILPAYNEIMKLKRETFAAISANSAEFGGLIRDALQKQIVPQPEQTQ